MNKTLIGKILTDIRFWIILFFVLRLIGITNAPLEVGHNWRQSLTNMIARNFLENSANILYPTIDMAGEKSGIIGSEFPFYNYLIYLASLIFDYSHWIGRLINLFVSSFGLYFFYKLLKNLFNKQTAFNSTIVLAVSVWFAFSRKIMPDTFSVSLVIIGLYYAYSFLKTGFRSGIILFFVFTTLGMLCKIPALSLFSVLFIVIFIKEIDIRRKVALFVTGTLSFLIVCLWYFYWVPYLLDTYHYQLYFPKGIAEGIHEIIPLMPELLEKFYFSALHSYIALTCALVGIILLIKSKQVYLLTGIAIISAVFLLFIIKTGAVFPLHNYYIIPFTPIMAIMAGFAIARIPLNFQYVLLGLIAIEGIANQQHDFRIKETQLYKLELEKITEKLIPQKDLIIINGGQSPQDIYFSNRKGWTVNNTDIMNLQYLDSLTNLGAEYLVVDITDFNQQFIQHENIYTDKHYSIYRLQKADNTK
jgi:4-amino-4-deoxy-L-arabinose transferase-like glycosyltransferase